MAEKPEKDVRTIMEEFWRYAARMSGNSCGRPVMKHMEGKNGLWILKAEISLPNPGAVSAGLAAISDHLAMRGSMSFMIQEFENMDIQLPGISCLSYDDAVVAMHAAVLRKRNENAWKKIVAASRKGEPYAQCSFKLHAEFDPASGRISLDTGISVQSDWFLPGESVSTGLRKFSEWLSVFMSTKRTKAVNKAKPA